MNQWRELRQLWDTMSSEQRKEMFIDLPDRTQLIMASKWEFLARPTQLSPETWGKDHRYWLILSGRGYGKTRIGAEETLNHVENLGSEARVALVGRTAADVRDVMIEGESGLLACARRRKIKLQYLPSKRRIEFASGAVATSFTAEKPDQLRGPQHTFCWCDELTSWEYDKETWDMLMFGLRLGTNPTSVITTTPKPKQLLRSILQDPDTVVTKGSTFENKDNLSPAFLKAIKKKYEGTRLGRQEIYGDILEDNPDALWQPSLIEDTRINLILSPEELVSKLEIQRVIIAVDPAVTSGENADETGIVVVGYRRDSDGEERAYILGDSSGRYKPDEWARVVVGLYNKWQADRVIAEVNNGGDLVEYTLRTEYSNIPFKAVRASKGKRTRAEPVAALYEQGKISHVGIYEKLEDQMTMFTPDNFDGSPDRVDALVWGLTHLMLNGQSGISFI